MAKRTSKPPIPKLQPLRDHVLVAIPPRAADDLVVFDPGIERARGIIAHVIAASADVDLRPHDTIIFLRAEGPLPKVVFLCYSRDVLATIK